MPGYRSLSVVIPTHTRVSELTATLQSLAEQDIGWGLVEVIVSDNGSDDGTYGALEEMAPKLPYDLIAVVEPHGGAAAARNAGVAASSGDVILFLGDDTPAANSTLLAGHIAAHRHGDDALAVLGLCTWAPGTPVTPVMKWLERTGKSHDYSRLVPGKATEVVVYSNNFSIQRSALLAVDGFDERFPRCNWEDYELGLRLSDQGIRVVYRPDLAVHHKHEYDVEKSLGRMFSVGRSARLVEAIHPKREDLRTPSPPRAKAVLAASLARVLRPAAASSNLYLRAAHYAALAAGYRSEPLPADPVLRGGIADR